MPAFQLEVHPDQDALVDRGIQLWQIWAQQAIADHGYFAVALAGGSTPKQLYSQLAKAKDIDWSQIRLFWGDERYVASDHPDSNFRMTQDTLLKHVAIPTHQIYPWPTTSGDPALDAKHYAALLRTAFNGDQPQFDLVLLGIGTDGHTASLFPETEALLVTDDLTAVGSKSGEPRLTLTFPVINQSHRVVFLVAGASKAEIVKEVLTTEPHLPSQQVQPQGSLLWFLDKGAAAQLPLQIQL